MSAYNIIHHEYDVVVVGSGAAGSAAAVPPPAPRPATAIPNIIALYLLMPVVKAEMNRYLGRLKSGDIRKYE